MIHRLLRILVLGGAAWGAAAPRAQSCDDPPTLRYSAIPKASGERPSPSSRQLANALERALGRKVEIVRSNSYAAVVEGLHAGHIDVAELGPAAYALLMERGPSVTAFAALSAGTAGQEGTLGTYRSVLVVRKDSGYQSLRQLQGKTVSLTDPVSTSGALLPIQAVRELTGQPMESFFSRITYAGSHNRALEAVQKGLVDAAFLSSTRFAQQAPRPAAELAMLWQSAPIPSDPYVFRSRLCEPLVRGLRQLFFESPLALQSFYDTVGPRRFVPVSDADYRWVRGAISSQAQAPSRPP